MSNYIGNKYKTQIISIKNALEFLALLPIRRYFRRINGNESEKTFLRPARPTLKTI
jgi:hypothetical protein